MRPRPTVCWCRCSRVLPPPKGWGFLCRLTADSEYELYPSGTGERGGSRSVGVGGFGTRTATECPHPDGPRHGLTRCLGQTARRTLGGPAEGRGRPFHRLAHPHPPTRTRSRNRGTGHTSATARASTARARPHCPPPRPPLRTARLAVPVAEGLFYNPRRASVRPRAAVSRPTAFPAFTRPRASCLTSCGRVSRSTAFPAFI